MTTTASLIPWFLSLGIAKVDQTTITSPVDPAATRYCTQPPAFGAYYTVSEFPSDDTGGAPLTVISLTLASEQVEGDPDASYSDGCITFEADPSGTITDAYFCETYAGNTIGAAQPIPASLSELQQLIQSFKAAFRSFVQAIEA